MCCVEPAMIQLLLIDDIETRVEEQLMQNVLIANLGGFYNDHAWRVPPQIQQWVGLYSAFGLLEFCLGIKGKTLLDGCRVQGIGGLNKIGPGAFLKIQVLVLFGKELSEVFEDPPISAIVDFVKRAYGDFSAVSRMIQFALQCTQACCDTHQAFSESLLCKDHCNEPLVTTEGPYSSIPLVTIETLVELGAWKKIEHLRKNYSSGVHIPTPLSLSAICRQKFLV